MKTEKPTDDQSPAMLERLAARLEAIRLADYLELLEKPKKLLWVNFVAGIARGLGFAIGTTIVFAVVIEILRRLILINIPLISDYLIDLFRLIEQHK